MLRTLIIAASLAIGTTAVVAQADAIAKRKEILKGFGEAAKPIGAFLKGEAPYDLNKITASLKTYADAAKDFDANFDKHFPANSKTGGDTAAAPKIWDDSKGFRTIWTQLNADATAALAVVQDQAAAKPALGKLMGNCKTCHDDYRIKK